MSWCSIHRPSSSGARMQRNGQAAYRRLNQLGLQLLSRDGMLVSCSCSYHLSGEELLAAIQRRLVT